MSLLQVTDLGVRYGQVAAVREADLRVDEGELVVIVGANGAGKSSLLKAVAGLVPASGSIRFAGRDLSRRRAEHRVRAGLCLVPEGRHLFGRMSVQENLQVAMWGTGRHFAEEREAIHALFPVLAERRAQAASTLSGGEQQMLAISRALVKRPRLLVLDEPSMGLAPLMVKRMFELIGTIHAGGTSVLLVEQNAKQALAIADRGYVLDSGRLTGGGPAPAMLADERLTSVYFGGSAGRADEPLIEDHAP